MRPFVLVLVLLSALGCAGGSPPAALSLDDSPLLPTPIAPPLRLAPGERASLLVETTGAAPLVVAPGFEANGYRFASDPVASVAAPAVEHVRFHPARADLGRGRLLVPLPRDGNRLDVGDAEAVWLDVRMPRQDRPLELRRSEQALAIELRERGQPLNTTRPLAIIVEVAWESLVRRWPDALKGVNPAALDRSNVRQADAFALLDALHARAAEYGVTLWIPEIAPSTKWPSGAAPQIAWEQYRRAVGPWVEASTVWPLPAAPGLRRYPSASRSAYWWIVADAFQREGWQDRARLIVRPADTPRDLLAEATVLQAALPSTPILSPANQAADVVTTTLPGGATAQWLDASASMLPLATPADVRLWGWAAFLRDADIVRLNENDLPIFAPIGTTGVAHTPALSWLRRAIDDHALLMQADPDDARAVAAALVRPTRVPGRLERDPAYALFAGTSDNAAWAEGLDLLVEGRDVRPWLARREVIATQLAGLSWTLGTDVPLDAADDAANRFGGPTQRSAAEPKLYLRADVVLRSPTDARPEGLSAEWAALPAPDWSAGRAASVESPIVGELGLARLDAAVPLEGGIAGGPSRIVLRDRYSATAATQAFVAPAAGLARRASVPVLDGLLNDWANDHPLLDGPGVPFVARGNAPSAGPILLHAGWTPAGLHVAFRLAIDPPTGDGTRATTTRVDTRHGRIRGEDAAEVLVTPVFSDDNEPVTGTPLHVVLRPNGQALIERFSDDAWRPAALGLGYAARHERDGTWRGELTIPWATLSAGDAARVPELLRFNFAHTRRATGRAASWAGPVDSGRDLDITGALVPIQ